MDINIEKMLKEASNTMLTPEMKQKIYVEYLQPLKQRITDILLYDEETANKFLQEYNSMIQKELDLRILRDITLLEEKVGNYEKNEGKLKRYKQQSIVLIHKIKELQARVEQMTLKELEYEFKSIREMYYSNLDDYDYKDREDIAQQIYLLQAKFITRKVIEEQVLDLYCDISKEDEIGLKIILNNEVHKLLHSKDTKMQDLGNEIKFNMLNRTDAVYDPNIWKMLATKEKTISEPKEVAKPNVQETQLVKVDKNTVFGRLKQKFQNMVNSVARNICKKNRNKRRRLCATKNRKNMYKMGNK